MFQMMNEARIEVGVGATALPRRPITRALEYSKKRLRVENYHQGSHTLPFLLSNTLDVKRMLLFQRSVTEGSLSLLVQCAKVCDLASVLTGRRKGKERASTGPLNSGGQDYPAEMGLLSISAGLQFLGGSGYCDDYPLEQLSGCRIHPSMGTTGIHGLDLLAKSHHERRKAYKLYPGRSAENIREAEKFASFNPMFRNLRNPWNPSKKVTAIWRRWEKRNAWTLFSWCHTLPEPLEIVSVAANGLSKPRLWWKPEEWPGWGLKPAFFSGSFLLSVIFWVELPKMDGLAKTVGA